MFTVANVRDSSAFRLQLVSGDKVRRVPAVERHLGVSLQELSGGPDDGASHVIAPGIIAGVTLSLVLLALQGSFGMQLFRVLVIRDRHGEPASRILDAVDPRGQGNVVFRHPRRVPHGRLAGETSAKKSVLLLYRINPCASGVPVTARTSAAVANEIRRMKPPDSPT